MAQITQPDDIHWVDGSQEEYDALCAQMVAGGTFTKLNEDLWPGCYYARSDSSDVARVEDRTSSVPSKDGAGPTNNWVNPFEMRRKLKSLFRGPCGAHHVCPAVSMGPIDSPMSQIGVELTDSPYVVVNMRIMARIGMPVFEEIDRDVKRVVPCVHSVGAPLAPGQADGPGPATKKNTSCIFPRPAKSGRTAPATRQRPARQEVLRAPHRLEYRARRRLVGRAHAHRRRRKPTGREDLCGGRLPERVRQDEFLDAGAADGFDGWKVWTVGDDIAWIKADETGALRAINPEAGFFGVAPERRLRPIPMP